MNTYIDYHIDCETPEQAAITCRILSKNNFVFEEAEHMPISGIRTVRFIVDEKTLQHYNILRTEFVPDVNDTIQIDGDKQHSYSWVGNQA